MNGTTVPTRDDVAAQAEELDAIRRRVVNVIGHELRTPVTTLHGLAAQACSATDLAAVTEEIGPAMLRGAVRLTRLLDDLLVAAGIQTAIPVGVAVDVDVPALVATVWAARTAEPLALDTGPLRTSRLLVHLQEAPLRRALEAVLDNAVAYSTAPPSVVVTRLPDGGLQVVVDSPGPALHPEEVRLATEPFFRGERAVTTSPGLGLGLPLACAMVAHLGGTLRVEATPTGTETTIVLPSGPI